jgi:hypothetical protein
MLPAMTDQTQPMALSRWIRNELKSGIVLTDDVLHYLEATFGSRDLSSILADADACEIDSMMELLFYPDLELQERYEAQWGKTIFTEQDRDRIIEMLSGTPEVAEIILPDSGAKISIPVPGHASRTFVQRLNICWRPPARLSQLLNQKSFDEISTKTRVLLRNATIAWHKNQAALISLFLAKMPAASQSFSSDLGFLISILSELAVDGDAYSFLIGKKLFFFKSLCSAEVYDRKRLTSNMEILMMSGNRSAHGSIDQWRQNMRNIDRICQTLFGRTQFFQQPEIRCIDLQDGKDLNGVTGVLY